MDKQGQPKKLNPRHYVLMRELLSGTPLGLAAKITGYTLNRASIIANTNRFKDELKRMQNEIGNRFIEAEGTKQSQLDEGRKLVDREVVRSVRKIIDLRDGAASEEVQLRSSAQILDRAGLSKVEKVILKGEMDVSKDLIFALTLCKKEKE